jgi:hypothetical protein
MEKETSYRLIIRQLRDIQAQADKIMHGNDSEDTILTFAKYSSELRSFILTHVDSPEIRSFLMDLPEVEYSPRVIHFWQYILIPSWLVAMYYDYQARQEAVREIGVVQGKFATLEVMVKSLES